MISGFGDQATEDIFNGVDSKAARSIPKQLWPIVRRKLDAVDAAVGLKDLAGHPGNRLEKLKGDRAGEWSIRVNDQYRIVITPDGANFKAVVCEDCH